jgi:dimethylamine/trimethylamine dehydrogenase
MEAASVVLVTSRMPNEQIYHRLIRRPDIMEAAGLRTIALIGDCLSPQTIAAAVYDGHQYARELDAPRPANPDVPFRRERVTLRAAG